MRGFIISFILSLCLFAQEGKNAVEETAVPGNRIKVAVSDFTPVGVFKNEALIVSEIFRTALVNTEEFDVVDRANMDQLLGEQALQLSGITSGPDAIQAGKILNVQQMIFGSFMQMDDQQMITCSLVDISTAQVVRSAQKKVENLQKMTETIVILVQELTGAVQKKEISSYAPPGYGILSINSDPQDAEVYVDGELVGKTRLMHQVTKGPHKIRVTLDGHLPKEMLEDVGDGDTREINLILEEGISLEYAKKKKTTSRKGMIRNSVLSGSSITLMGICIGVGAYQNKQGDGLYEDYNETLISSTAAQLRGDYQTAYNDADKWFLIGEAFLLSGTVFLTFTIIDIVRYRKYNRIYNSGITREDRFLPVIQLTHESASAGAVIRF